MPIDQAHEQNNEAVKGYGGAVGLTSAFRRWMVSCPNQATLLTECEDDYPPKKTECRRHYEEGLCTHKRFIDDAVSLAHVTSDLGNPLLDDSDEVLFWTSQWSTQCEQCLN